MALFTRLALGTYPLIPVECHEEHREFYEGGLLQPRAGLQSQKNLRNTKIHQANLEGSMTVLQLLLCFFVSFAVAHPQTRTSAQRQLGTAITASQSQQPQLQLTASVANERYTVDKYGVRSLDWTLKLTYTNTANEPILLDQKSSLIYRSMVSRSLKAAASKKYEYDLNSHFITVENMRKGGISRWRSGGRCFYHIKTR
jgi:hypothetical protein